MNPEFEAHLANQATWIVVWVYWLVFINFAAILFVWKRVEARWVLAAMVVNLPLMNFLFETVGWVRLLGLSHVLVWTPLLLYLWWRRDLIERATLYGKYLTVLFVTNFASLILDYHDVARHLLGDGTLPP